MTLPLKYDAARAALMRAQLAAAVSDLFPLKEDESPEAYVDRACAALPEHLRLELLRRLGRLAKAERAEQQRNKDAWILAAREAFVPLARAPCQVCGKFKEIANAHHLVPLAWQWERGFLQPDQDHVWLCPNHHIILHALLGRADDVGQQLDEKKLRKRGRDGANAITDVSLEELDVLLDLLAMSSWGHT